MGMYDEVVFDPEVLGCRRSAANFKPNLSFAAWIGTE